MNRCSNCGNLLDLTSDNCPQCGVLNSVIATEPGDEAQTAITSPLEKYRQYQSQNPLEDQQKLQCLLRDIYADWEKTDYEDQLLGEFAQKCAISPQQVKHYEQQIRQELGVDYKGTAPPLVLLLDKERKGNLNTDSVFRAWVKNISGQVLTRVQLRFVINSSDVVIKNQPQPQIHPPEAIHCYVAQYYVPAHYRGGEISFRIEVDVYDHHERPLAFYSQNHFILSFAPKDSGKQKITIHADGASLVELSQLMKTGSDIDIKASDAALIKAFGELNTSEHEQLMQAVNVELMLDVQRSTQLLKQAENRDCLQGSASFYNFIKIYENDTLTKRWTFLPYPFFTLGLAKSEMPWFSDFAINATKNISRIHCVCCYVSGKFMIKKVSSLYLGVEQAEITDDKWHCVQNNETINLGNESRLRVQIIKKHTDNVNTDKIKEEQGLASFETLEQLLDDLQQIFLQLKQQTGDKKKRKQLKQKFFQQYYQFIKFQKQQKVTDEKLRYIVLTNSEPGETVEDSYFLLPGQLKLGADPRQSDLVIEGLESIHAELKYCDGIYYWTQLSDKWETTMLVDKQQQTLQKYQTIAVHAGSKLQIHADKKIEFQAF